MRHAVVLPLVLSMLAACAPTVEVRDMSRDGALVFSSGADAAPVRTPCQPGSTAFFPGEDYYTLPEGEETVPLSVRVADRNGVARVAIVFPLGMGRPVDRPDAREALYDLGGDEVLARVIVFDAALGRAPPALEFRFTFRPGLSSGDGFYVAVREDAGPPPAVPASRLDLVSVRRLSTVCGPPERGSDA